MPNLQRFGDITFDKRMHFSPVGIFFQDGTGQNENGRIELRLFHGLQKLPPIEVGHVQIEEDQVNGVIVQVSKCSSWVCKRTAIDPWIELPQ